ncbi:methyltransferase-like protein 4 [Aspergillus brasiliensis]|uniref:Methyltransferase-like protein 4 n=1 Tax=Aspergillus brasiliensis TaxID=319629 RepID=A0A9W5YKR4_9EURO|nr:methyltransferase-like protein 4 [Aspergillus brasiliensis]GKZ47264.1 methyltransferase-like protein 4 [Aspergillus brasiliensis]
MAIESSILYENPSATAFVVDIPSSIALAQALPRQDSPLSQPHSAPSATKSYNGDRVLLSSTPLREPYLSLTEPKTEAARARVLERIPLSERRYHSEIIEPLVAEKIRELNEALENNFERCLPRVVIGDDGDGDAQDGADDPTQGEQIQPGKGKRKRQRSSTTCSTTCSCSTQESSSIHTNTLCTHDQPPLILAPGENAFESISELSNTVVRNTSFEPATVKICCQATTDDLTSASNNERRRRISHHYHSFHVPPSSHFLRCTIPISEPIQESTTTSHQPLIPGLSLEQKFDLILLDPPWTNRSVRRSGHYQTQFYKGWDLLTQRICDILQLHLQYAESRQESHANTAKGPVAAIWITNSAKARKTAYEAIQGAGLDVCEEWIWLKITTDGRPITELGGLWRKPYEVLVIGGRVQSQVHGKGDVVRRVVAAVPDVHSRKPNLKGLFERMFFSSGVAGVSVLPYSALEVFARNLTAGWWACGDDVLKFNSEEWWVDR